MPTFEQTREVVIPNNGSTVDRQPTVNVQLSAPLGPNTELALYINGVLSTASSVEVSPTEYSFSPRCAPGVYTFRVDVIQKDGNANVVGTSPSNERNIRVADINQAWSSVVNQDGPYVVGNSGTHDNMDDFNWHDSFWLAVVGNVKPTDIVSWETSWVPGMDGDFPPVVVQHPAQAGRPHRLELQARLGSKGSVSYSSGVMNITLMVNGVALGDVLELTLDDDQTNSVAEGASWRVAGPLVPPTSIHLSNSVTMLPVDNSAGVVWYDFVVPSANPVVIDTIGGTADTEIALYNSLGHLVAQDDSSGNDAYDSSLMTLTGLTPGATYYLAVGEYSMVFGATNWQATQPDGSTGETLVLNANLNVEPVPLTYVFSANEFGGNQLPPGSGDFVHTFSNDSGQPMVVDLYGVADVSLETSSPGTTSTRLVPAWSRMLGGAITGYEFWEDGEMLSSAPWDPYDTTEQTVRPVAISEHLYNGHSPAANRFVRFFLDAGGYVEMVTAFDTPFAGAAFTGQWSTKAVAREVAPSLAQKLEIVQSVNLNQVGNPFSVTWDYSSSANGNVRTELDLPIAYGTPTPGVSRYFLKDGQAVTASMTMHANAVTNNVLQPGDIVILQGVLHVGTLTGTEDSQTRNALGGYSPLTHTVTEHVAFGGTENLQLVGEQGVDWLSTRTQCNYPLGVDAHTFTVQATPIIEPGTGYCDFWYGPFVTLTQAEMDALPNGSLLTSVINGVAVYRGGSVSPANLVFADVNREIFTMRTEVRSSQPARIGWGTFAFDGTTGSGATLEFVNGRIEAGTYDPDTTLQARVSTGPNVYGRLNAATTCAFGLVSDDGSTYTVRVEYGPPGYDSNGVQFPASTLNATTCPVTWDGYEGTLTLPAMAKPCTGVLGEDNDVRIYLVRDGVDVGYLLMNVVDVPNSFWEFQVPVWFAYTAL